MSKELIDENRELINPTVADVIAYLSQFAPETPFRIEDPDTMWTINIVHASRAGGIVWFMGEYSEMNSGPEEQKK